VTAPVTRSRARLVHRLGTAMAVAGAALLVWALAVWQWKEPFTTLYTLYEQNQLAEAYEDRHGAFASLVRPLERSAAADRNEVAADARRYRKTSNRGDPVGRLKIPRLGLDLIVVNGTDDATLRKGPGRDLRSFMPGEGELVYVAGHRTTYGAPFSHIERLRRGDRVLIETPYATFQYAIKRHVVVSADDVSRLRSPGHELLALQACHPRFFASHRYIAYAALRGLVLRRPRSHPLQSS
jgi:sortase A